MANERMMREASPWKLLLTMSLPTIVVMIVNVLYNMADVYFIGQTGDTNAVAVISLAAPVFSAISACHTLIGFGGSTAISIALGEGNKDKVRRYSAFVVWFPVLLSAVIMVILFACMPELLQLLGTDADTFPHAQAYLRILTCGTPFMLLSGAIGNSIRADGDAKSAMLASMAGTIVNIVLDPLFILHFGWGSGGAALATVIGYVVSMVLALRIARRKEAWSLSPKDFTLRPEISLRVLSLGLPMAGGTLLMSFAHIFSNRLLVAYGNQAVAARSVAGKISMLIPMVLMGVCMGIQPAVSYAYGRRDLRRLKEILLDTGICATAIAVLFTILTFAFRRALVTAFLPDPSILDLGMQMVIGCIIATPVYGIYQLCSTFLQGTGRVSYATVTSLLRQGLVYVPVNFLMNAAFGLNGLIYASAVTDILSTIIGVVLCILQARRLMAA